MLNIRIIIKTLGLLLIIEGFFMFLSLLVSLIYQEPDTLSFVYSTLITIGIGSIAVLFNRNVRKEIGKKEGFLILSLVWITSTVFGTLPYILSGSIPNLTDAFFETMSGFTTTGSSIITNVEALPHGILFWRSITQWMGGMGIIVFGIAILSVFELEGLQLISSEVPGHGSIISSKIFTVAKKIWIIYIVFTIAETILLWIGGMGFFDAINHSFTTMSTGGFSTKQTNIAYWPSPYIQYVITFFMIVAGTNSMVLYYLITGNFRKTIKNEELRYYLMFIVLFASILFIGLLLTTQTVVENAFRDSIFQVVSIITTTGYTTINYMSWTSFLTIILFVLFFFGSCTGSTGGGLKIMRVVVLLKNSYYELYRIIHPNAVIPIRFNSKSVPEKITSNVFVFFIFYLILFFISTVVLMLAVPDLISAMGAVASCLGNIGPGLGEFVPAGTYSTIHPAGKWFLSLLMLLGRLEFFTFLVIFLPVFWKR